MKNLSPSLCCGRDVETLLYWQFAPEGREESKGGQGSHVGDEITLYSRTRRTARVAVLAVIAYHLGMQWAPGGLLGVTVFFVLSGYLITSLLLIEWDNTETINLPQFWLRRVRRLMPAIVLIIVCTAALCALFDHSLLTNCATTCGPRCSG